ncbi:MAG: NAD-dependent epimerase/dehydratase family protein [Nitrospirae bacterium]|nr:NAD-dependent epimerase/dehydratase family protein [Nitrospirota bacterium]
MNLSEVIIGTKATIVDAIELINKNGILGVFVCDDDNELIGIMMDSDIRRAILNKLDINASVKTIMKTNPFYISQDLPVGKKNQMLVHSGKMLAPVVDDKKRVVDYVYLPDILNRLYTDKNSDENGAVLPPQKVAVIGGAGYIGSVLVGKLLRMGYSVRVLDLLLYGKDSLTCFEKEKNLEFIRGDCRDERLIDNVLDGVDAVIHLGEIVGDPACRINESFTIDTNYSATHMIVESCIKRQIKRFVFASSCSVYGQNDDDVNEESALNPVSLYARCKIQSEEAIFSVSSNFFCPTVLRLATVHGKSYRQRFDLVVNLLVIKAVAEQKIQIFGGEQWRPFISVNDICSGIVSVLHAESYKVKNQIFNLGDSRENYQLIQIGNIVKEHLPETAIDVLSEQQDKRNYRVNFDKIKKALGFTVEYKVDDTVKDLIQAYRVEKIFHDYNDSKYHNYLSLK